MIRLSTPKRLLLASLLVLMSHETGKRRGSGRASWISWRRKRRTPEFRGTTRQEARRRLREGSKEKAQQDGKRS